MTSRDRSALEFAVLRRQEEIDAAAEELEVRGLAEPAPAALGRVVAGIRAAVGRPAPSSALKPDRIKSWDVLRTVEAVSSRVEPGAPVLDVGAVSSAILPYLHRLGYSQLVGIDLDERVLSMPHAGEIEWAVEDLMQTTRPAGSFGAIVATSVIEHGVDERALLAEVSRLLRSDGIFVFSTDYWPDKIDTNGMELFGLPWRIFSAEEIESLLVVAREHGLRPISDPGSALRSVDQRPIAFAEREYTFLYGVLVRA